jgi:hypothetical protein
MAVSRFEKPAKQEIYDTYVPLPLDNIQAGMEYVNKQEDSAKEAMAKNDLLYSNLKHTPDPDDAKLYNELIQKEKEEDQEIINKYNNGEIHWRDWQDYTRNKAIKLSRALNGQGVLGMLHREGVTRDNSYAGNKELYSKSPDKFRADHPEKELQLNDFNYTNNKSIGARYYSGELTDEQGGVYSGGSITLDPNMPEEILKLAKEVQADVTPAKGGGWNVRTIKSDGTEMSVLAKTKGEVEELTAAKLMSKVGAAVKANDRLSQYVQKVAEYDLLQTKKRAITQDNPSEYVINELIKSQLGTNDASTVISKDKKTGKTYTIGDYKEDTYGAIEKIYGDMSDSDKALDFVMDYYAKKKANKVIENAVESIAPIKAYTKVKRDEDIKMFSDAFYKRQFEKEDIANGMIVYQTEKSNPNVQLIDGESKNKTTVTFDDFLKTKGFTKNENGELVDSKGKVIDDSMPLSASWKWTNYIGQALDNPDLLYHVPKELKESQKQFEKFLDAKTPQEQIDYYYNSDPSYKYIFDRINKTNKTEAEIHRETVEKSNAMKRSKQRTNVALGNENSRISEDRKISLVGKEPGKTGIISGPINNYVIKDIANNKVYKFQDIPFGEATLGTAENKLDAWKSLQGFDPSIGKGTIFKVGERTYYAEDAFSEKEAALIGKNSKLARFNSILDNPEDPNTSIVSSYEAPELNEAFNLEPHEARVFVSYYNPNDEQKYIVPAILKDKSKVKLGEPKFEIVYTKDPIPLDDYTKITTKNVYGELTEYNNKSH